MQPWMGNPLRLDDAPLCAVLATEGHMLQAHGHTFKVLP